MDEGVILQECHDRIEAMARYLATFTLPFSVVRPPELVEKLYWLGGQLLQTGGLLRFVQ